MQYFRTIHWQSKTSTTYDCKNAPRQKCSDIIEDSWVFRVLLPAIWVRKNLESVA